MDDKKGVWRTIRGRRIFIADGESLESAMQRSGKFDKNFSRKERNKDLYKKEKENTKNRIEEMKKNPSALNHNMSYKYSADNREAKHLSNKEKNRYNRDIYKAGDRRGFYSNEERELKQQKHNELQKKLQDYRNSKLPESVKKLNDEKPNHKVVEVNKTKYHEVGNGQWRSEKDGYDYDIDFNMKNKDNPRVRDVNTHKVIEDYKEKKQSNNKYASVKREGFGDYNKDNIPVYNNEIDYTGDFGRNANLKSLSDEELTKALNKQSELYHKYSNEKLGDQRTRNGRMNKIFNTARVQQYEDGMKKLNEEMKNRNMPRYEIYENNNRDFVLASAPTKEMAERQVKDMYETDKNLKLNNKNYSIEQVDRKNDKLLKTLENDNKQDTIKKFKERKASNKIEQSQKTNRILEKSGKVNQKILKSYVDDNLATDITRYSDKAIDNLEKKHGRLTHLKTSMGTYGMNGALLKSEKTGEYFVITSRNSTLFRLV